MSPMDADNSISWTVLTHEHQERTNDWYWALGLIALVGIGVSIYFNDILFAIVLALGVGSLIFLTIRGPREHDVALTPRGINIDGTLYRYPTVRSCWVAIEEVEHDAEFEPRARLFLATSGLLHPTFMFPLEDVTHAEAVRDYLLDYVEEVEQEPHFTEHLAALLGI